MNNLINKKVEVFISDPWNLCEKFGSGPFTAQILKIKDNLKSLIIEFDQDFLDKELSYKYFNASIRHHDFQVTDLLKEKTLSFSFLFLPKDRLIAHDPFDESWWRGGGMAFIGTMKIIQFREFNSGDTYLNPD